MEKFIGSESVISGKCLGLGIETVGDNQEQLRTVVKLKHSWELI